MLHPTFSFRPPFTLVPGYLWEVKMLGYWIYAVLVLPDTISCLQNAILIYIPIGTTQDCPLNSFTNSWHYGTLVFFLAPIWWKKYFTIVLLFISPIILKFGQLFTFINQLFFYLFITHPFNNQRPVSTCWAEFHRIHLFFLSLKKKRNISYCPYFGMSGFHDSSKVTWGSSLEAMSSCNALRYNLSFQAKFNKTKVNNHLPLYTDSCSLLTYLSFSFTLDE